MVPVMLAYDVAGSGPAAVLLHSAVCDRRMWDPQWPVLAEAGYRVMRCDFRGFGSTPVPPVPLRPLRAFWQREEELIEAGDTAGATELNVATWLGPDAGPSTGRRCGRCSGMPWRFSWPRRKRMNRS